MADPAPVEVEIQILQRSYRLVCLPEKVESLQESARNLDEYMREMRESQTGDVFSIEKLAIAVAVNLIGELKQHQEQLSTFSERADQLKDRVHAFTSKTS